MSLNDLVLPVGLAGFGVLVLIGLVLIVVHHMTPRGADRPDDDEPWPPETPPAYPPPPHPDGGTQ